MNGNLKSILRLTRAHFLIPGIMLYVLGACLASARGWELDLGKLLFGYAIFGMAHLSVSFSNDYFDRKGDVATERTPISGGSGILLEHPELSRFALLTALALMILSISLGIAFALVYASPWWFLLFVFLGNLTAWFYSAPPVKLAYRGLGEVATALAAGFLMPGMGYLVVTGTIDTWFLIISLPLLCYGLFFIISVELPDVENDRRAGKINLLVVKGRDLGLIVGMAATALGTTLLVIMTLYGVMEEVELWVFALFSIVPLIAAFIGMEAIGKGQERIVKQVKMNFGSLMIFLLCIDLVLLFQLV